MNHRLVAAVIGVVCLLVKVPTAWACSSDNECKGDRVCDNQICTSPAQPAPAAVCRADVDCPVNSLCTAGVCSAAVPGAAVAPPAIAPPPVVQAPPESRPSGDTWQYGVQEPPARPLPPPVLVMRSPRLHSAGIALVTLGLAMEVIGIAVLASSSNGACAGPPAVSAFNPNACSSALSAGSLLMVFGIPVIANGAWMWPVGGAMVPQEQASKTTKVMPYFAASRDGGGFGLQLAF